MATEVDTALSSRQLADRLVEAGTVLLDTADAGESGRAGFLFEKPVGELVASDIEDVVPALEAVDRVIGEGLWVAGFISYEAGYAFEKSLLGTEVKGPLLWFGVYDRATRLAPGAVGEGLSAAAGGRSVVEAFRPGVEQGDYRRNVWIIRNHIREGDVYQINYTFPLLFEFRGDSLALYRDLRLAQPVPYAAYINDGRSIHLSMSPELFFERRGSSIVTRPMKGTAPAGRTPDADADVSALLQADAKNRAENLMIVDLLRNDLSRCCRPGSVKVPALFTVHRYPTVLQMTSTVEGTLREDADYLSIFRALFPCGSVTGAPKIKAMEIIRELEPAARGVYCGAIGFISPHREATFSVAIRTVSLDRWSGRIDRKSVV